MWLVSIGCISAVSVTQGYASEMDEDTDVMKAIERVRLELVTRKFMVVVLALIGTTGALLAVTGHHIGL